MGYNNVNVNVSGPKKDYTSTYKTYILRGNMSFADQVTEPNVKYVVKYDFDLGGGTITIPEGCLLEFDGGTISNGTIEFDNTILIYNQQEEDVLKNITMVGDYEVSVGGKGNKKDNINGMGKIYLKKNKGFGEQLTQDNTIYVIQYDFVLGEDIIVPENCVLEFDGGSLTGGNIVLSNTLLKGSVKLYTSVSGSIINKNICIDWFLEDNNLLNAYVRNVFNLTGWGICVFSNKTYIIDVAHINRNEYYLSLTNKIIEGNNATITTENRTSVIGNIFMLRDCQNVTIKNFKLDGGITDEQLEEGGRHNISMSGSCQYVYIHNILSKNALTDGLYISNCENVYVEDSTFSTNGRQGCSLIHGKHIFFDNCTFEGSHKNPPRAGMDIEPNEQGQYLQDINITNCRFLNNASFGLTISLDRLTDNEGTNQEISIVISKCIFDGNSINFSAGTFRNSGYGYIKLLNSTLLNSKGSNIRISDYFAENTPHLIIDGCTVRNANTNNKTYYDSKSLFMMNNSNPSTEKRQFPLGHITLQHCIFEQPIENVDKLGKAVMFYPNRVIIDGVATDLGYDKVVIRDLTINSNKYVLSTDYDIQFPSKCTNYIYNYKKSIELKNLSTWQFNASGIGLSPASEYYVNAPERTNINFGNYVKPEYFDIIRIHQPNVNLDSISQNAQLSYIFDSVKYPAVYPNGAAYDSADVITGDVTIVNLKDKYLVIPINGTSPKFWANTAVRVVTGYTGAGSDKENRLYYDVTTAKFYINYNRSGANHSVDANGFHVFGKTFGANSNRPNITEISEEGYQYYNKTEGVPQWYGGARGWVNVFGLPDSKMSGNFGNKPTKAKYPFLKVGQPYFCTNRQTAEGATDGIMIYYKGQDTTDPNNPVDIWVDALGRVVS